jgi:hypothetical protein
MAPLTLILAPFTLEIPNVLGGEFPRLEPEGASVEFSNHGNSVGFGPAYLEKYLWSFNTALHDLETLRLLHAEFKYRRTTAGQNPDILLYDLSEPCQERTPRTRAIVPGTVETLVNGGTHVQYYAQFYVWFTVAPKITSSGTTITLAEMGKVAP